MSAARRLAARAEHLELSAIAGRVYTTQPTVYDV